MAAAASGSGEDLSEIMTGQYNSRRRKRLMLLRVRTCSSGLGQRRSFPWGLRRCLGFSWSSPPPQVGGRGALCLLVLHLSKYEEIVDHGWQQGHRGQRCTRRYWSGVPGAFLWTCTPPCTHFIDGILPTEPGQRVVNIIVEWGLRTSFVGGDPFLKYR